MNVLPIGSRHGDAFAFFGLVCLPAVLMMVCSEPLLCSDSDRPHPLESQVSTSQKEFLAGHLSFDGRLMEAGDGPDGLSSHQVVTTFHEDPDGKLVGEYKVVSNNEQYAGTLVQHGAKRDRAVTFDWKDKFGTGTLDVVFDDDACEFTGTWWSDGGTRKYPWQGHSTSK